MRFLTSKGLLSSHEKLKSALKNLKHPKQLHEKAELLNLFYFGCPGCEVLERRTKKVQKLDDRLNVYIESLKMTAAFNNLVSLSAPQVGIDFSFFVMLRSLRGVNTFSLDQPKFPNQYRALINPRVLEESEMSEYAWETCGSFWNAKARVKRPISIKVDFYNDKLEVETEELEGFPARVFQHETDHLEGKTIMNLEVSMGDFITNEKDLNNFDEITESDQRYFETMMKLEQMANNEGTFQEKVDKLRNSSMKERDSLSEIVKNQEKLGTKTKSGIQEKKVVKKK